MAHKIKITMNITSCIQNTNSMTMNRTEGKRSTTDANIKTSTAAAAPRPMKRPRTSSYIDPPPPEPTNCSLISALKLVQSRSSAAIKQNLSVPLVLPDVVDSPNDSAATNQSGVKNCVPSIDRVPKGDILSDPSTTIPKTPSPDFFQCSSPTEYLQLLLLHSKRVPHGIEGKDVLAVAALRVRDPANYDAPSLEQLEAYDNEKISAVRDDHLPTLRAMHAEGHIMNASNRFGESLLHVACRRGRTSIVSFFIDEASVSARIRDDMGRTPMHDLCWSSSAPDHDAMRKLVGAAPELLFARDKRGHFPFDYARMEHRTEWLRFLVENEALVVTSLVDSTHPPQNRLAVEGGAERIQGVCPRD